MGETCWLRQMRESRASHGAFGAGGSQKMPGVALGSCWTRQRLISPGQGGQGALGWAHTASGCSSLRCSRLLGCAQAVLPCWGHLRDPRLPPCPTCTNTRNKLLCTQTPLRCGIAGTPPNSQAVRPKFSLLDAAGLLAELSASSSKGALSSKPILGAAGASSAPPFPQGKPFLAAGLGGPVEMALGLPLGV